MGFCLPSLSSLVLTMVSNFFTISQGHSHDVIPGIALLRYHVLCLKFLLFLCDLCANLPTCDDVMRHASCYIFSHRIIYFMVRMRVIWLYYLISFLRTSRSRSTSTHFLHLGLCKCRNFMIERITWLPTWITL